MVYQYDDGLLDYVQAPELRQEGRCGPRGRHRLRNRGHGTAHRPGNGDAVDQRVLRERPHLRQHHQHPRGRHPRRGLPRRDDLAHQPLRAGEEHHQGKGRQPHRRRHPRRPDGRHLGQAGRAAVRGPDQDQARQLRGQGLRPARRHRRTRRLAGTQPRPGPRRHPQGHLRGPGPHGRPQGPRQRPPQEPAGILRHARQALRLLLEGPGEVRGLHRGGRLRRRFRQARPQPRNPGHPAAARQDPERGAGPAGQGPGQRRGPVHDHRVRHGHRRGLRPRASCGITRSS